MRYRILPPILLVLPALLGQAPSTDSDPAAKARGQRLLDLHRGDAEGYSVYRDAARSEKLTLHREPIFRWINPVAAQGQTGDVFIWTYKGLPEVVGTIFSFPDLGGRAICHEFNAISQAELTVERGPSWRRATRSPGMLLVAIDKAPAPAATAPARLAQMRSIAREFTAVGLAKGVEARDLRLLPTPLYRFESTDPDVLDGGLFAFTDTAGTDPELILAIEARRHDGGFTWDFGAARFSALELSLRRDGREVWNSLKGPGSFHSERGKVRWWFSKDRNIPEINAPPTPTPAEAGKAEAK